MAVLPWLPVIAFYVLHLRFLYFVDFCIRVFCRGSPGYRRACLSMFSFLVRRGGGFCCPGNYVICRFLTDKLIPGSDSGHNPNKIIYYYGWR